jgi:Flp pilus assembly CpaE family ATPase
VDNVELSVLIVDEDVRSRNYLSALLFKQGYNVRTAALGKEGYIAALQNRPDAVIFDPAMSDIPAVEFTHKLRTDRRTAGILCIALARKENPAQMADLLGAGCTEYLIKNQENIEKVLKLIADSSPQVQETQPAAGTRRKKRRKGGLLCVFLSAKGGTGTSSLCANIAQNIASNQPEMDVAVMDMVLPIGSIGQMVGYHGDFNLITAATYPLDKLDGQYLRRNLTPLESWHFRLLSGSPDPEASNTLDASRIPVLIRAFRQAFDVTFVDLGRSLSRISLPIIQEADVVVVITGADLSTVNLTQITWNYLQQKGVDPHRIYMVMNRAVGLEGLGKSDAERIIGITLQATIPYMGGNFTLANNQHIPVLQKIPNDTAAMMLDQISYQILETARQAQN